MVASLIFFENNFAPHFGEEHAMISLNFQMVSWRPVVLINIKTGLAQMSTLNQNKSKSKKNNVIYSGE